MFACCQSASRFKRACHKCAIDRRCNATNEPTEIFLDETNRTEFIKFVGTKMLIAKVDVIALEITWRTQWRGASRGPDGPGESQSGRSCRAKSSWFESGGRTNNYKSSENGNKHKDIYWLIWFDLRCWFELKRKCPHIQSWNLPIPCRSLKAG